MDIAAAKKLYPIVNVEDALSYVPFDYPGVLEPVSRFGEISLVRTQSYNGKFHAVGFWKVEPGVSPLYDIPLGDETGMVLEGSATIELLDADHRVKSTLQLRTGDVYTFEKGTLQRWQVHESFRKFVIVVDDQSQG